MAALTRRTVLAGLSAAALLPPGRALRRLARAQHHADAWTDRRRRRRRQRAADRRGPVAAARPAGRGRAEAGAAGTLAAAQVARAAPDGYTLGFIPSGHAVTAATVQVAALHPLDDFTIVGQAIEFPFVIVTHAEHPIRNMPDLIKAAKAAPSRCSAACRARERRSTC